MVVLGLIAGMWLFALIEPENLLGVIFLEAITVPFLVVALRWRQRLTRRLADLPGQEVRQPEESPESLALRAPPFPYDPLARHELVLRPRAIWRVVLVVGPLIAMAWFLKVSYDEAEIIPQIWFLALQFGVLALMLLRSRVVVAGGALWRRSFRRYNGVDLASLQSVELTRASYLKNEGLVRKVLRVRDRAGRMVTLKPALWSNGARPLLAGLGAVARQQGLILDQRTSEAIDQAASRAPIGFDWTATVGLRGPLETEAPASPAGKPRPLLVVGSLGAAALLLAISFAASSATNRWLRAERCERDRHLWTPAPVPAPAPSPNLEVIASQVADAGLSEGRPELFLLDPSSLANEHNTVAVRRGAQRLSQGVLVQWLAGQELQSEVYIEQFDSPASANQFHQAYGEDHCRNDKAFAVPQLDGAVGFRCRCDGDVVDDRVSFVRGDVRVQSIVWTVPRGDNHQRAVTLAEHALRALGG